MPFVGRDEKIRQLKECLQKNMTVWQSWCAGARKASGNAKMTAEIGKREYRHPAVVGGPGRGKTTLMTRGLKLLLEDFKKNYTGRSFLWDLADSPLIPHEIRPLREQNFPGAESVMALRILHQSINGGTSFNDFIAALDTTLEKYIASLSDVTLEVVLDHILALKLASWSNNADAPKSPLVVAFHISKTNQLLHTAPYLELQTLMKAAYFFNKQQAESDSGRYFLVTTFDGTHRSELLEAFESSRTQPCLIELQPPTPELYESILHALADKGAFEGI